MFFKSKLFSSDIEPACVYCKLGLLTKDGASVLCLKRGVCHVYDSCKKFVYDPLKRIPKRPNPLPQFDPSDFDL